MHASRARACARRLDAYSAPENAWCCGGVITVVAVVLALSYAAAQFVWMLTAVDVTRSLANEETASDPVPFIAGCRYPRGAPIACLLISNGRVRPLTDASKHVPPTAEGHFYHIAGDSVVSADRRSTVFAIVAVYVSDYVRATDVGGFLPEFVAADAVELAGDGSVCMECPASHTMGTVAPITERTIGRRRGALMARYATHNATDHEFLTELMSQAAAGGSRARTEDTLRLTRWNIAGDADAGSANCSSFLHGAPWADACTIFGVKRLGYRLDIVTQPPEPTGDVIARATSIAMLINALAIAANYVLFVTSARRLDPEVVAPPEPEPVMPPSPSLDSLRALHTSSSTEMMVRIPDAVFEYSEEEFVERMADFARTLIRSTVARRAAWIERHPLHEDGGGGAVK